MRAELQSSEKFEEALRGEVEICRYFGLTLCVLWVRVSGGLDAGTTRRLLDGVRSADPATAASESELAIILPNISPENARAVAGRLSAAVPEAAVGRAIYEPGDTPQKLLQRARRSLE